MTRAWWFGSVVMIVALAVSVASGEEPGREFTATARMETPQGSRSMPITLLVSRYTPIEEALHLAELLAAGGQGAVLSSLRGRFDGQLRLGAVEFSISLAVAEPIDDGYRYLFVTARRIGVEEVNDGADSLDYPFGVAVFELGDFGRGRGEIYPEAALAIGDDGRVEVEQYQLDPGELSEIKRVR